jgi:hypothetical protein
MPETTEPEPMLPLEPPPSKPVPRRSAAGKTWRQRVKAVFTEPVKLPGWAAVLFVAVQVIPDWKSRFDFWLEIAESTGGYFAVAASVIASPYFTPSLLAAGLAWIIFAGESPRGVQRHHWLRYAGWSILIVCVTVVLLTAGYGGFTFYVKQLVSEDDHELQRKYAVRPVFWHLTDIEKTALGIALDQIPEDQRFDIQVKCLPDAGSRTYVEDLGKVFLDKKWKIQANCFFSDIRPDLVGLLIGISPSLQNKKLEELPKNIATLAKILDDAHISAQWAFDKPGTDENVFSLIVGNPP